MTTRLNYEDFKSEKDRQDHFERHNKDLNNPLESPEKYEDRANEIAKTPAGLLGTKSEWWVYNSNDNSTVKYNPTTNEICIYRRIANKDEKTGYDSDKNIEISSYYKKPYNQFVRLLKTDYKNSPISAKKRATEEDLVDNEDFMRDNNLI